MDKHLPFDGSRRAALAAAGSFALGTALRSWSAFAQDGTAKTRIGVIGSGHIGGTIGGLWV